MNAKQNSGRVFSLCLVTQQRFGESTGGVVMSIWRMVKWFREKQVSFVLVFPRVRGLLGELSSSYIAEPLSSPKMTTSSDKLPQAEVAFFLWAIAAALRIVSINKRWRFSAIHAFGYRFEGVAALIASRLIRIPYSVHIKGPGVHLKDMLPSKAQRFLRNLEFPLSLLVLKHASLVLCESEEARRSLHAYIGNESKIQMSPPPITIEEYRLPVEVGGKIRERLGIQRDAVVIGCVGRLSPSKNVETLMRAYRSARRLTRSSSKLLIIGSGPLERELKQLAQGSGIENDVLFLGRRYDISLLLQAMDIFVIASFFEGYSSALLEAMAAGKAIVASSIPSNREILGEDGGLLFDPNDIHALEGILADLINNSELRAEKSLKACRLVGRYDLDEVCEDFLAKLRSMATTPTKGASC